ncbi:MAG: sensor histidine kinase, partial [Clostridiales bacterium]|nr:sensor histidine kinase [Clostridiales bacterium]
ENITGLVTNYDDVNRFLFEHDITSLEYTKLRAEILTHFNLIVNAREDIYNIAILSNNNRYLINDGRDRLNTNVNIKQLDWYKEATDNPGQTVLSSSHVQNLVENDYKWVITLCINIRNPYTNEASGIFFIDLNYDAIIDLCEVNSMSEKGYIFILDEKGDIIYHPQLQLLYSGLKEERIREVLDNKTGYFITDEEDGKLYTISVSDKTGWTTVGVEEVSELMKNSNETKLIYFVVTIILLIAVVAITAAVSYEISSPIKILKDSMELVQRGQLEIANIENIPNNEIGSLSISFNIMVDEIRNLMDRIVYEQKEKRKSELRALQSQINPHFLYNTLDSIIWMAEAKKTEEVVIMTSALSKLLRQSISNENEELTIFQEISYINSYLTIQQMRYKDILEYEIDFEKDIYTEKVLKLTIQPIVENAIYHGIKNKGGKCLLQVIGRSVGPDIVIKVIDNGVGMSKDQLDKIFDRHKVNYNNSGIGVYNVQRRLKLHYGKRYGLEIESQLDEGTTVTITIPKKRENELI